MSFSLDFSKFAAAPFALYSIVSIYTRFLSWVKVGSTTLTVLRRIRCSVTELHALQLPLGNWLATGICGLGTSWGCFLWWRLFFSWTWEASSSKWGFVFQTLACGICCCPKCFTIKYLSLLVGRFSADILVLAYCFFIELPPAGTALYSTSLRGILSWRVWLGVFRHLWLSGRLLPHPFRRSVGHSGRWSRSLTKWICSLSKGILLILIMSTLPGCFVI